MPATTRREKILQNVQTTLDDLRTTGAPTYHLTMKSVTRGVNTPEKVADASRPSLWWGPAAATRTTSELTGNQRKIMRLRALVYIAKNQDRATALDELGAALEDVQTAIMADVRRGGNAAFTRFIDDDDDEGKLHEKMIGKVTFEVIYHVPIGQN